MTLEWTVEGSERLLSDRWMNLRVDHCRTPKGRSISPYYVLDYPDWVVIVALTEAHELVMVEQYRHGVAKVLLELPAGAAELTDQDMEVSARRELLEETGFAADRWTLISSLYANPATQSNRLHIFLAEGARKVGDQQLDRGEEGMIVHVKPLDEIVPLLATGIIGQAMHVAGLLLALAARR
ncbi:hydrolase [Xaviernesmea oryzae]|uniref:GDP-mannose pyrophosphatase n=1 Tax=Xaviernesmea oryzae TaxID=464029 RepID=A0A1Q9ARN9_9HYPH|nr:NUDIX hydrolase [Xaviernesmea oryzae]OLP58070.1 hydrolase [Xaviernesmea oryzae]SEL83735.1 NUDIX domain-containing protein [Xaviernesmea oryzae]